MVGKFEKDLFTMRNAVKNTEIFAEYRSISRDTMWESVPRNSSDRWVPDINSFTISPMTSEFEPLSEKMASEYFNTEEVCRFKNVVETGYRFVSMAARKQTETALL